MNRTGWLASLAIGLVVGLAAVAEPADPISQLQNIGKEGANSQSARAAVEQLVAHGPAALPKLLAAIDSSKPIPANWLRTAIVQIARSERAAGRKLAAPPLKEFLLKTTHDTKARRLAYDLLVQDDEQLPAQLLPLFTADPCGSLRYDAIAYARKQLPKMAPADALRKLLTLARDKEQVEGLAKELEALGEKINLTQHFNFVTEWYVAAGFDNTNGIGFAKAYPPEAKVDLTTEYAGKNGPVKWKRLTTTDVYGVVDFNKLIAKNKNEVAYAYTEVEAPQALTAQIRVGSYNAVKIFLNGKEVFGRDEYHHGMSQDQHIGTGAFVAGTNKILLKLCQNNQTEQWAQNWGFQCRICDDIGGAVAIQIRQPGK